MDILQNIANMCGCDIEEAQKLLDSEIKLAKENMECGDDLSVVVEEVLSALGIEADYEIEVAQMICGV